MPETEPEHEIELDSMAEYNDTEEMNLSTLSKVREKTCVLSHKENKKLVSSLSLLSDSFGPKRKGSD